MLRKIIIFKLFFYLVLASTPVFGDVNSSREILGLYSNQHPEVLKTYDKLVYQWINYESSYPGEWDLDKLLLAVEFAAKMHGNQIRKDLEATPYIIHPIGVAKLLWEIGGVRSSNVLIAAILHDTLEDTEATEEEIKKLFGIRVLNTVKEISNDPKLTTYENKQRQIDHAKELSLNGQLIKLADRLYNVLDLENPPPSWDQEKIDQYRDWGAKLLIALRGTNPSLENALAALTTERASNLALKIEGHFKVNALCYLLVNQDGDSQEYVRLFLENGTSWSFPFTEKLFVQEGDIIKISLIPKDDSEYLEGKRYRIIGMTKDNLPVQISFYPYSFTEKENGFYSGILFK